MVNSPSLPPALARSFKGLYPFRLAATSYVFPAGWAENARRLGPVVDEIQLLLFESRPASLPTPAEIRALSAVATAEGVGYSIHLPLDIYLGSNSDYIRKKSLETINRIVDTTLGLHPRAYVLHLEYEGDARVPGHVGVWRDNCRRSLEAIGKAPAGLPPLVVENLDYPLDWIEPLAQAFGLKWCIDVGHLIGAGIEPAAFLNAHLHRTAMVHLYGNPGPGQHRHLALDRIPRTTLGPWLDRLRNYRQTLCLEVFSPDDLAASLVYLQDCWSQPPP
jgi:sugar phosphate isomerase/epimerase